MRPNFQNVAPEILGHVFVACLPTGEDYPPDLRRCTVSTKLGLVCSYWYQVSLATAELWCGFGIEMDFRSYSPENDGRYADKAKLFITRSGNRPLSIKYDCIKAAPFLIQTLLSCKSRWGSLWLSGYPEGFGRLWQALQLNGAENLISLKIHVPNNHGVMTMTLNNTPKLAHIDLRGPVYLFDPVCAPLRSLQSLRLTHHWLHSVDSYFKWVEKSPELLQLRLEFVDFNFRVHPGRHETSFHCSLEKLVSLVLDCNVDLDNQPAKLFLDHITTPVLEFLQIRLTTSQSHSNGFDLAARSIGGFGPNLMNFLRRSSPTLKTLIIGLSFLQPNELLTHILPLVPTLIVLELPHDLAIDEVLHALSSSDLCPKLSRLILHDDDGSISIERLAALISSRCTMEPNLLEEVIIQDSTFTQQEEEYQYGQSHGFRQFQAGTSHRGSGRLRALYEHLLVQQAVQRGLRIFMR